MAIKPVEIVIKAKDQASATVKDVARAVDSIDPAAKRAGASADTSMGTLRDRSEEAATAAGSVAGKLDSVKNTLLGLVGIDLGVGLVKDIAATADEFRNLESRIRLVVGAEGDVAGTLTQVAQVAKDTFTSLDGTTQLFTRLAASADELQITQGEALDITRTVNQAIQVSGASATASDAAVKQLVQGLQGGVLRGDEFNSVMEQAPRLAKALADGLGVPIGALREMAEQGELTAATVVTALQGQRQQIEAEFTQLPLTIGRAVQNLKTEFVGFVGVLDGTTGASSAVASGIQGIADQLDVLARVAGAAGAAMTAGLAVQGVAALKAAGGAATLLATDINKIPKIINITVAAVGFEIGFQIGEMLHENSELARRLGVGITEFIQNQVNSLTFLKEAAQAVFTDDTVAAALQRYNERAAEMRVIFKQMYEDAKEPPKAIEESVSRVADAMANLGDQSLRLARDQKEAAEQAAKSRDMEIEALQGLAITRQADARVALTELTVKRDLARQSEAMARLMGDEAGVREAKIAQLKVEIEITRAKANMSRVEAEGIILVAKAKLEDMRVSGEIAPVKEAELQASIKLAEARIKEAEATAKGADLLVKNLELLKKSAAAASGLSTETDNLAGSQRDLAESVGAANDALGRQRQQLEDLQNLAGAGGDLSDVSTEDLKKAQADLLKEGGALSSKEYIKLRNELMDRADPKADKEGFTLDKSGNRLAMGTDLGTLTGISNFAKSAGLDEGQAKNLAREFSDGKGNIPYFSNPGQMKYGGETLSAALLKAIERITFGIGQGGAAGVGRTVQVNINTGSGTETVNTDEAGARALVRGLSKAARRAGR